MLPSVVLVLGGAASGKSRYAEAVAKNLGKARLYIATAQAFDAEMADKIFLHREQRAADGWRTVEAPLDLAGALSQAEPEAAVLVDCLTMWVSNLLLAERDVDLACDGLLAAMAARGGPTVVVSNEVGQGIVPDNPLARRFRDAQGGLNRRLAAKSDRVVAVMAGLPMALKGPLPEVVT